MKQFKKGDKVTVFSDWDSRGTIKATQCIVLSCGKKQMTLALESTGENSGRNYRPSYNFDHSIYRDGTLVVSRLEGDELQAAGMDLADDYLEDARFAAHFKILNPNYTEAFILQYLRELHEPRVIIRENLVESSNI